MAELSSKFEPSRIETSVSRRWEESRVFAGDPASGRDPYVIVIPPPNVTAMLHMGHGLNNTIQDLFIRFERMRGREAVWLPGTDHAGIATQNVVERLIAEEDGSTRFDVGREAFLERVWSYVNETGQTILEQLKAIGASCDWNRTRFTLDDGYSAAVRHVFVSLWEEGLIYRGHRVIHWCPRCLTALSDEEAEFHDARGKLYHIRYPLTGEGEGHVTVATTRPETLLGDTAVAVHPDHAETAWALGRTVRLPLTEIHLPIIPDDAVDPEFGTGFVKITPAHDATDFEIGGRHNLAMPLIMDPEGRMHDPGDDAGRRVPEDLEGVDRFAARTRIVERLDGLGLLEKVEPHAHAVRQCYRCHTVVEPRLSKQWFVRMAPLAAPALEAYRAGHLRFVPERWGCVYENWLTDIRDWNISRQLWWGHRIPVFRCTACGEEWAARTDPDRCRACGASELERDPDVLDTWFSSWLWPFATFGWPEQTPDLAAFYPGHTLVTAQEIIFFWVARMVMAGYHFLGARPFDTVYIHGTVRDTKHRKMSKSLGNGIDPLEVVRLFGADALRYTVIAGAAVGADVILDPDDLEGTFAPGRNFANKVWNAGRLAIANLEGEILRPEDVPSEQLPLADRWILSRAQRAARATTDALERHRVSEAADAVYHFIWDDLADWYLEQVKPRLYGKAEGGSIARGVLLRTLETALALLHPVMPFVTEELWSHLPGPHGLLASAAWPTPDRRWEDDRAEAAFGAVQEVVSAIRAIRAEYRVPPGHEVDAMVKPGSPDTARALAEEESTVLRLARLGTLALDHEPAGPGAFAVLSDRTEVFVPLGDAVDLTQECARLLGEIQRLDAQLTGVARKLANTQFVAKAPVEVVERERAKEASWREQRDALTAKSRALGC
ncbi:MAG TPA: valine--tRNA ligase [Gemmatimonadales bacterium]